MLDSLIHEQLDRLQQLMADEPFVVLTGAGISTPSGIPDSVSYTHLTLPTTPYV